MASCGGQKPTKDQTCRGIEGPTLTSYVAAPHRPSSPWLIQGLGLQPSVAAPNCPDLGTRDLPRTCPSVTENLGDYTPHSGCIVPSPTYLPSPRTRWGDIGEGHSVGAQVQNMPMRVLTRQPSAQPSSACCVEFYTFP